MFRLGNSKAAALFAVDLQCWTLWEKISSDEALLQWNDSWLVGVESSSIEILGVTSCDIHVCRAAILVKGLLQEH